MKRFLNIFLCFILIFNVCIIISFAEDKSSTTGSDTATVKETETALLNYLNSKEEKIQIGTPEYTEYLVKLLTFENDESLKALPQYENIKIYASEYLTQIDNPNATVSKDGRMQLNKAEEAKTIADIKEEAKVETMEAMAETSVELPSAEANAAYSDSKAVAYARKWALSYNPLYNSHAIKGDCTNFVSQCVIAGGKSMKKPSPVPIGIKSTTTHWYSIRYEEWHTNNYVYRWNESTSFIRVTDFFTYWKNNGISTAYYSTKNAAQNGAAIGDVVQLKNGDGKWYHSIIITGGSKGNRTFCAHSDPHKDKPVSGISGAVSYRSLKF